MTRWEQRDLAVLVAEHVAAAREAGPQTVDELMVIRAPATAAWAAIVQDRERAQWWGDLALEPRIGGRVEERWRNRSGAVIVTRGEVLEVEPERLLRVTWADEGWPAQTELTISVEPLSHAETLVRVRHEGFAALPDADAVADDHRVGWRAHLEALRRHLER